MSSTSTSAPAPTTRNRLLHAATELFREQGFVATSLAQVARRAGFTTGAVYVHFESKEDLFLALMDWDDTADFWSFLAELDASGEPDDGSTRAGFRRLGAVLHDRFTAMDAKELAVQLELFAYALRNARAGEAGGAHIRRQVDAFGTAIGEGFAAQGIELSVTPAQLVVLINALLEGLWLAGHMTDGLVDRDLWLTSFELLDGLVVRDAE